MLQSMRIEINRMLHSMCDRGRRVGKHTRRGAQENRRGQQQEEDVDPAKVEGGRQRLISIRMIC